MSTSEQDTAVTRHDPLSDEGHLADEQYPVDRGHEGAEVVDQQRTDGDPNPTLGSDDPLHSAEPRGTGSDDQVLGAGTHPDDVQHSHSEDPVAGDLRGGDTADVRDNGTTTGGTLAADGTGADAGTAVPASADGTTTGDRTPLVPGDRADAYASRWNEVKGMFVDEPRQAVQKADQLVGELLEDLERGFRDQRQQIEHGLDNDDTSTEDLRMALRRYRSFFDRLLSV